MISVIFLSNNSSKLTDQSVDSKKTAEGITGVGKLIVQISCHAPILPQKGGHWLAHQSSESVVVVLATSSVVFIVRFPQQGIEKIDKIRLLLLCVR